MSETTQQLIPGLMPESTVVDRGFQSVLDYIDEVSRTTHQKGELFERLMQVYFLKDPIYKDLFTEVYSWGDWATLKGFDRPIPGLTSLHRRLTADTALSSVNATQNKESGIVNDPNGWFADPRELVAAIERIASVSMESTRIIEGLPARLNQ